MSLKRIAYPLPYETKHPPLMYADYRERMLALKAEHGGYINMYPASLQWMHPGKKLCVIVRVQDNPGDFRIEIERERKLIGVVNQFDAMRTRVRELVSGLRNPD